MDPKRGRPMVATRPQLTSPVAFHHSWPTPMGAATQSRRSQVTTSVEILICFDLLSNEREKEREREREREREP